MRYPDTLRINLFDPDVKIRKEKFNQFESVLRNFGDIMITQSSYAGSGANYRLIHPVTFCDGGEIIVRFERKEV